MLTLSRLQAGAKIADLKHHYDALFETMPEGFAYFRAIRDDQNIPVDFQYIKVNTPFERLTGLSRVQGKRVSDIPHDLARDHPDLFATYRRVARTGKDDTITITPGTITLSVSVYPSQDGYFLAVFNNITGKARSEHALKVDKTRFEKIITHLPIPLFNVIEGGVIREMNSRFIQTFGYSHLEIPTLHAFWEKVFPDEMYRQWVKHTWQTAVRAAKESEREILPAEYTITCQNGDLRVVELSGIAIEKNLLVTFVDVTERRHAEEAVREANQKLRFLTGITRHDIFNQLNAMYLYLDMALEETELDLVHDYVRRVQNAGKRIEAIIGFTREFEHFGTDSSGWQNINAIIEAAKTEVPSGIITISSIIPDDLEIYADPIIRKVFTTFFDNAIRHGGKEISQVILSAEFGETTLTIISEDDGAGVAAAEKEKIFQNGFGKNTGIGLFLSREILAINDLSIIETGTEGTGARFEISVPAGKFRSRKTTP